jgi:uncharacterized membrane protein YeaQ/YmgE (transglycosylase-associated protein family)
LGASGTGKSITMQIAWTVNKGEDKMTIESIILFLVIGLVAGWLAGRIMKGGGYGLVGDLIVGVIGAFLGGWLFNLLGISLGGILGALITALIGAIVLLYLLRLIKR